MSSYRGRAFIIYCLGYPPFFLTSLLILWGAIISIPPYEGGGLGWTGALEEYFQVLLGGYSLLFIHLFCSPLLILTKKIKATGILTGHPAVQVGTVNVVPTVLAITVFPWGY